MATTLYFRNLAASMQRGTNSNNLAGSAIGWVAFALSTSAGAASVDAAVTDTVAGTTNGVEVGGVIPLEWISEPLDQDVTISGTITHNVWMHESAMTANVGAQVVIERLDSQGGIVSTVSNSEQGTELGTTNPPTAARNWTNASPTSTAFLKGDRIRIRVAGNDGGGTMASGATFTFWYDDVADGTNGDSFITFTETFGFETTTPAGSQLFLTDVAGPAVGANIEKEMWTSRGDGVNSFVRNTAAGWTAPLQWTDSGGGTAVEWYSKQVQAFTLGDLVRCNLRALESNAAADASIRAELATCDNDGTNVTIWGAATYNVINTAGELTTIENAHVIDLSGDDLSVASGQRLRLRVYLDDTSRSPLVTGHTATLFYDGTSGGASGDSWIQLTQSVSEFVPSFEPPILVQARRV